MFFSRQAGTRLVHRGEILVPDFQVGDFTIDDEWHDLDLSSILPANAFAFIVAGSFDVDSGAEYIQIRPKGFTGSYTKFKSRSLVINAQHDFHGTIFCNNNQIVEYQISIATWATLYFCIRGWWI